MANVVDRVATTSGAGPHLDFNRFMAAVATDVSEHGVKLTAKRKKLLQTTLATRNEAAEPVIRKIHKPGRMEPDPIRGFVETLVQGKYRVVEYEPDSELRDTEQVPLLEEGGIEAFLRREMLPYAPDAWYVSDSVKVGYEISFTRYFYKPQPLRTLEEIQADIFAVEKETQGLLEEIVADPTMQLPDDDDPLRSGDRLPAQFPWCRGGCTMTAATDNVAAYVDLLGFRSLLMSRPELARPDGWDLSDPRGMFNAFHSTLDAYALDVLDSHCERFSLGRIVVSLTSVR